MHYLAALLPLAALTTASRDNLQVPIGSALYDQMPLLGFGTWNLDRDNASAAVSHALQTGYRHIDCAAVYGNEPLVGKGLADGLKKAEISREDIWVTSKLWNDHHDPSKVEEAIDTTLSDLGLEYLDLYLMHWPVGDFSGKKSIHYLPTWEAMIQLLQSGKTRHIGISNFSPAQLKDLLAHSKVKPAVHQMEMHPYLQQRDWLAFHEDNGIHVTAYSPLAGTNPTYGGGEPVQLLKNKHVGAIAEKRDCTPAQVALAWGMSRGTSVIPKSSHARRIEENFGSKKCDLHKSDYETLAKLGDVHYRYNNPSKSWGVDLYEGLEGTSA